jgi:hypothetical protein
MFRVEECAGRKGGLQKTEGLLPTGARADNEKSTVICGMTSRSPDYVKT